jgi:hypothetical protein
MKLHRGVGLVALSFLIVSCYPLGPIHLSCESEEPDPYANLRTTAPVQAQPDGGPSQPAPEAADSASAGSAFVPAAEDLIVRLTYGDAMVGPGWLRVEFIDPTLPDSHACDTKFETASEEGLSAYGTEDYTCQANVFNANAQGRQNPQNFTLRITSSFGYEFEDGLLWLDGSFTNAVGNVLSYSVP